MSRAALGFVSVFKHEKMATCPIINVHVSQLNYVSENI